jgi:1-acyl-sn-glycerol-3-phosphate acyltransferase
MTEQRDKRFSDPMPIGKAPAEFLPELKPSDPQFLEKLAAERGFKYSDKTSDA